MSAEELNKTISFLKKHKIFLKKRIFFGEDSVEETINSFSENHIEMKMSASWGSLDFQGSEQVWDLSEPSEEEVRKLF